MPEVGDVGVARAAVQAAGAALAELEAIGVQNPDANGDDVTQERLDAAGQAYREAQAAFDAATKDALS